MKLLKRDIYNVGVWKEFFFVDSVDIITFGVKIHSYSFFILGKSRISPLNMIKVID